MKKINKRGIFKMNILKKLVLVSLIFVILPVAIVGSISALEFSNTVKVETLDDMQYRANNKLKLLKSVIEGEKNEAYAIAHDNNMINTLLELKKGVSEVKSYDKQKIRDYLSDFYKKNDGMYENIFLTDSKGVTIADALNGKADGVSVESRDYFTSARDSKKIILSDAVVSASTGNPIVVIAVPLYGGNNEFLGILGMPVNFTQLMDVLIKRDEGEKYNYIIFNKEGTVIAHESKDVVFKSNMAKEDQTQKDLYEKMLKNPTSYGNYILKGIKKTMTYTKYEDNSWFIACSITIADYMKPVNNLIWRIVAIAIASVVVASIFVLLFSRSISKPLESLAEVTEAIAEGDLTREVIVSKSSDEIGTLTKSIESMVKKLKTVIYHVREMSMNTAASSQEMTAAAEEVSSASFQITHAINELAKGATNQAVSTEKGNEKIADMILGIEDISSKMLMSQELSANAKDKVEVGKTSVDYQICKMRESKEVANRVETSVEALSEKSSEIGGILNVIMSISEQTNLLSLNAAIEAARAGEQGKGFSVVAEEIRKLADQSTTSVRKINDIIKEVQEGVGDVVSEVNKVKAVMSDQEKAVKDTINAFSDIEEAVANINNNIKIVTEVSKDIDMKSKEASNAMIEIATISEEAASGTEEVAASTQQQLASIEQVAEASKSLSELASKLQKNIEVFQI
jgi:methyl-accepting chemotaxis protein